MLSWRSGQLVTSFSVKKESCPSHELYFPPVHRTRYKAEVTSWVNCYVRWAQRRDWLWWNVPTALLCTSSVWHWQHSWVCVISGAVNNSETLSSHSLLSSQVPLEESVSRDSLGRRLTTKDVWSSSVSYKVANDLLLKYLSCAACYSVCINGIVCWFCATELLNKTTELNHWDFLITTLYKDCY